MRQPGVVVLVSLALSATAAAIPGTSTDARATEPPAHPLRIVALGLHNDEIALALAPDRVVAVDAFADDPEASFCTAEASQIPRRVSASAESILGAQPDLVLLPGWISADLEAQLASAGVAVVREPVPLELAQIRASLERLGALLDAREAARALSAELDDALAEVDALPVPRPRPTVALLAATGTTPGRGTLFAELVERAGGRMALDHAGITSISVERLLAADPSVVFVDAYRADGRARAVGEAPNDVLPSSVRGHLTAYREGRTHALTPRVANTTSHHVTETIRAIAHGLRE